ncbi:glycosyltransferase [Antarcticibacterium flavum]|uniref:Glycosyltransferase n=2 Tax=Flavobacteriaceae TaxID=49546 RepID=A0A5B7X746_9FLAO|nr:family 2 glycosyl transferase [Antarcticibacterium sp. W02-3]QCY71316.1 glycosyltransferase [Antarcticibacterium flavum]
MIPVYNCSQFIPEVLESVLKQHIAEKDMQIEVVDDASTDADVEKIVQEIGKGRINYFRQSNNIGSLRNFETCINRSHGKFIHLLHGDDRVLPGYYHTIQHLFRQYPKAGAAFCNYRYIDEIGHEKFWQPLESDKEGILENWLLRIAERNLIQYAAITVKREVYEELGSFYGSTFGEDWEMWVRIAQAHKFAYTPKVLAEYRQHDSSITGEKFLNGDSLKDLILIMDLVQKYVPQTHRKTVLRKSKKFYAWYGLHNAADAWKRTCNKKSVHNQIRQLLKMHNGDFGMYKVIAKLYLKMLLNYR